MADVKKEISLNDFEEQEYRDGIALAELKNTQGFKVLQRWLEDRAYHTWADPRETNSSEEWQWRELNAFHAANNAKELLVNIDQAISRADYLGKIKSGEIPKGGMKI
jgi:hypothetical protein